MTVIILIACLALIIFCLWKLKIPKCGNLILVTGGVKTGKTTLSVRLVKKLWKKNCTKVKIYNRLIRPFKKDKTKRPMPLIYSNIPLTLPYAPLTKELIYREHRFEYGSVVFMCEASLIAGSMDFSDPDLNDNISALAKLIAHETKGGYMVMDTQSVLDLHYGLKRNTSSYFYIHHKTSVPLFLILKVRELVFLDNTSNDFSSDAEDNLKTVIVPKSTWKHFDCYCYSALTDHLPVENTLAKPQDLKAREIVTFKKNAYNFQKVDIEKRKQEIEKRSKEFFNRMNERNKQ